MDKRFKPFTESELQEMERLYSSGVIFRVIGQRFDCDRKRVSELLKARGVVVARNFGTPEERHKRSLAKHGRVELVGPFMGRKEPSLYRCLAHGEVFYSLPQHPERGHGLKCCKRAKSKDLNTPSRRQTFKEYQELFARMGVELVGPWRGSHHKTELRCLKHQGNF